MERFLPILCIAVLISIAYAFSEKKDKVDWKLVSYGIVIQIIFAFLILKTGPGRQVFEFLSKIVSALLDYTGKGASFVFGDLVAPDCFKKGLGYIFAFNVLPTIVFFSSFMAILYHLGIMQKVIYVIAWVMQRTLKTSGAESLSASANIFVGQTEAPLVVKPYIEKMTRSEIMCVMTGGMATVAGGVMASYVGMLKDAIPTIAGHLMAASVMAAPVAMVFSKILVPETDVPETSGKMEFKSESIDSSVIDACSRGCSEGMGLAINVAAMLIGFTAMIALLNDCWGWFAKLIGLTQAATLQDLLGYILYPLTYLLGIRPEDRVIAGGLIGEKTILNEFVAYSDLANRFVGPNSPICEKTQIILSYALCGFANFSSIGIQIAGIGGLAPKRRSEIAGLALKALLAATLTCFFTASIASIMYEPNTSKALQKVTTAPAVNVESSATSQSAKVETPAVEQKAVEAPKAETPVEPQVTAETPKVEVNQSEEVSVAVEVAAPLVNEVVNEVVNEEKAVAEVTEQASPNSGETSIETPSVIIPTESATPASN